MENQLKSRVAAKCNEEMSLTYDELEGLSTLTDQNFNLTRGLYANPIWNPNNHIIFILRNARNEPHTTSPVLQLHRQVTPHTDHTRTHVDTWTRGRGRGHVWSTRGPHNSTRDNFTPSNEDEMLIFSFKFFWRFFRGYRTIVCLERGCARYDPFKEKIIWSDVEDDEFFDFTVNNMNGKPAMIVQDFSQQDEGVQDIYFNQALGGMVLAIFRQLESSMNFSLDLTVNFPDNPSIPRDPSQFEMGQATGADFHLSKPRRYYDEEYVDRVDHSPGVESKAMCIVTPHSEFMPQLFVGFKTFEPLVWVFVIITILIFAVAQYVFQYSQCRIFQNYYSDDEVILYESTSSLLTVYSYFICGSPPTLLLGRFFTGKVLFLIFSFSALIISSVFLSGMTTLLADPVRYPEIDSLQDLEASDILIQVPDHVAVRETFTKLGKSEALRAKLISTLSYYNNYIGDLNVNLEFLKDLLESNTTHLGGTATMTKIFQNFRAMLEVDASVIVIPGSYITRSNVKISEFIPDVAFDYHFVEECLSSSPHSFSFLKSMFLNDKFRQKVTGFLEFGLAKKSIQLAMSEMLYTIDSIIPDESEPRPYNLHDLQPGFISLVIGLLLSFLVFICELLVEYHKDSIFMKYLLRVRNWFSIKCVRIV
ncbi:unnamed protein product [Bemisia tabaci]|uniref:Ionotropic receptor n=1 Tax=Bemisia tabaci TaxID=7038 RepID=A0A9P0AK00_BEMTA|nr:unnamed protein product [Bemisia tabaci]